MHEAMFDGLPSRHFRCFGVVMNIPIPVQIELSIHLQSWCHCQVNGVGLMEAMGMFGDGLMMDDR